MKIRSLTTVWLLATMATQEGSPVRGWLSRAVLQRRILSTSKPSQYFANDGLRASSPRAVSGPRSMTWSRSQLIAFLLHRS